MVSLILTLLFLLIAGDPLFNRPSLLSPPGLLERLKSCLTANVAETRLGLAFHELHPPPAPADAE